MRLSICIPVYNFGGFIGETLNSILGQCQSVDAEIEVLVVDGASTDNTLQVVSELAAKWPQLRYLRLPRKGGIDADLAESVRFARGEYCWLFSGDDLMHDGALGRAIHWLGDRHDVYLCKHSNCDINRHVLGEHPVFRDDAVRIAEFSDPHERRTYLSEAMTSEAVFSFMSGLIIRREKWMSVPDTQEFMGSCWAHVARLLTAAQVQLRVCYVGQVWLDRRAGNDSFLDKGAVNRLRIAVDGYHRIADGFFGRHSLEAENIRRLVRNDLGFRIWLYVKYLTSQAPDIEDRQELDRLVKTCYCDSEFSCWLARTTYRVTPPLTYGLLRSFSRQMAKILKTRDCTSTSAYI